MKTSVKYLFHKIENFFLWSSGADLDIISQVPNSEKNKYLGIGGTIIFTALMACFAGGYAFFTAFKNVPLAIMFGFFWGLLIYNLDRFIVSTFGSGDGKRTISKQELYEASPRLVMAILLGFVISTPLEIKIFEKEIKVRVDRLKIEKKEELISTDSTFFVNLKNKRVELNAISNNLQNYNEKKGELVENNVKFLNETKKELEADRADQNTMVQSLIARRNQARSSYYSAIHDSLSDATISYRKQTWRGIENQLSIEVGKRNMLDQKIIDLQNNKQQALIEESNKINAEISSLTNQRDLLVKDIAELEKMALAKNENYGNIGNDYDGFAAHLEALDAITEEKPILFYVKWLITFLFIFIEIAPILFKMMTERGPYDEIHDRVRHEYKVRQLEIISNINQEVNTAVKIHTDKYEQKLNAELVANREILIEVTKAQQEIAAVAIEKWKEEQKLAVKNGMTQIIE